MSRQRACGSAVGSMLLWLLVGCLGAFQVRAGYLGLNVTQPNQCSWVTVEWWGDDGPYHMLLTPTEILYHGYNVWVPEIQNGTNKYNLTINQPQGLQFVVTMWGASGVQYAGTTDVITVGPPPNPNATCFLSQNDILDLYDFSFNISDASFNGGFPAQCSNLSLFWPTSLQNQVQNISQRSEPDYDSQIALVGGDLTSPPVNEPLDVPTAFFPRAEGSSTSQDHGITTTPPTIVGIIPLGNSFVLPVTYDVDSPFADTLPPASLSNTPTTFTAQGITYLNWTVSLAKGTRFILVAGNGSEQAWASGGSSALITVGQGTTDCSGFNSEPSVTSGPGASTTGSTSSNTGSAGGSSRSGGTPWGTIVACVLSVAATLVAVGLIWFCCRIRRRRVARRSVAPYYASGKRESSVKSLPLDMNGQPDTPMELLSSRGRSTLEPITMVPHLSHVDTSRTLDSPASDDTMRSPRQSLLGSSQTPTMSRPLDRSWANASPGQSAFSSVDLKGESVSSGHPMRDLVRGMSSDALLGAPMGYMDSVRHRSVETPGPSRRLVLHAGSGGRNADVWDDADSVEGEQGDAGEGAERRDDVPDLKRETLAYLGGDAEPGSPGQRVPATTPVQAETERGGIVLPAANGRRRRPQERETEYVVHRDAGRVPGSAGQGARRTRTVELPPRYDELELDRGRGAEGETAEEGEGPGEPTGPGEAREGSHGEGQGTV